MTILLALEEKFALEIEGAATVSALTVTVLVFTAEVAAVVLF